MRYRKLSEQDWANVAIHLRRSRQRRRLSPDDVVDLLIKHFDLDLKPASLKRRLVDAESLTKTYGRRPKIVDWLAELYDWPIGAVERLLTGGELEPTGRARTISPETQAEVLRMIDESGRSEAWKRDERAYWGDLPTQD